MEHDVASLAKQLVEGDAAEQLAAAEALARLGGEARPAAASLVQSCASEDASLREWSAAALEELGPPPAAQLPELTILAESDHPEVAYWAITLLGRSSEIASRTISTLTAILAGEGEMAVRQRAAWALGKIGPAASPALPALKQVATCDDPRLSRLAQQAIEAITV